ncbi:MAG: hypothetical protein ACYCYR_09470 [Desulfobulbaceae bacterium]
MKIRKITGECERCGRFEVERRPRKRELPDGTVRPLLPTQVVCPSCSWWCKIVDMQEIVR